MLAGPVDLDLDHLLPDLLQLVLLVLGAVVAVVVTSALLLTGLTVGLTRLRRRAGDEEDE